MSEFQKNKNLNRFIHSKLFFTLLFFVIIFLGYSVVDIYSKSRETVKNRDFSLQKLDALKEQEKNLIHQINKLNSDQGIESELRERFGVVKEGERLIVIIDDKEEEALIPETKSGGFLNFFRNIFK